MGSARLAAGQVLQTQDGRAEFLLTPGVFVRLDSNSSVQMVNPGLANTIVRLQNGRAMVEVAEMHPENNIRVDLGPASIQMLKAGLYDFNAATGQVRVFDGRAVVQAHGHHVFLTSGHQVDLNTHKKMKPAHFNKKAVQDDFYRWASLRSSYLAEANVDQARAYAGGSGYYPAGWDGDGWYWDPWFDAYTFIPGDGIFFDPFGWGFYSPWMAFGAPYYGLGFGYGYPYGGFGGYYRHFGPGYRPPLAGLRPQGNFAGHAYNIRGNGMARSFGRFGGPGGGFNGRTGGFGGGMARGGFGGFHGGGFHGGGFGGGGFHGGGGRR